MASAEKRTVVGLLGHPFIDHCNEIRPYVDYVKLVIKLDSPMQSSSLRARLPASWEMARINITPAGRDIPGALNPTSNSTNFYTLTICEPHIYPFDVSQLSGYLKLINGKLSIEHCQVEFGIDFFSSENKDAYQEKMASFLVRLLSHLKHKEKLGLLNARVFCPYPTEINSKGKNTRWVTFAERGWIETLIKDGKHSPEFGTVKTHIHYAMHPSGQGCTLYAGNSSRAIQSKLNGIPTRVWKPSTELRAYFKTKDNGSDLPKEQHRFRVEFIAPCQQPRFTLDPVAVLSGDSAAACTMAKFFALILPQHPLLSLLKQALVLKPHTATTDTKLRNTIKRVGHPPESYRHRIGADSDWNRRTTEKFIGLARRMQCASFTAAAASTATPTTPATPTATRTAEISLLREKTHTSPPTGALASAYSEQATEPPNTPCALITPVYPPPSGGEGYSLYITDEELQRMLDEM